MVSRAARVLYVDLSAGTSRPARLDPALSESLIGGFGINNRLVFDLVPPGTPPLSPQNPVILGAGLFAGTIIPGSAKLLVTTRFPINGAFATASGGGAFPLYLKSAGYDHVVIAGRVPRPSVLLISEGGATCEAANDLWGQDTYTTDEALRAKYGECSVVAIGPAGENLVASSIAFVDRAGTVGRGGLAAVLASKNLKAIVVVRGGVPTGVADHVALQRIVNRLHQRMMDWPGRLPVVEQGLFPAPPEMSEVHRRTRRPLACPTCPLADKLMVRLDEGPYAGLRTYMPHLSIYPFTASDPRQQYEHSIRFIDALNRHGIGGTNFTGLFFTLVELFQRGIIGPRDTGGITLKPDIETALELVRLTSCRQGFGELLARGPAAVAGALGERGRAIAHIKGNGIVQDPRLGGLGTMEFEQLTMPRGAHVAAAGSPSYEPGRPFADFLRHGERMGAPPGSLARLESEGRFNPGLYSRFSEDWYALFNCLGLCNRAQVNRFYHVDTIAELYTAVTGVEAGARDLMAAAERAWTLGKLLNVREGFDRRHDSVPDAWFEPLARGGETLRIHDYAGTTELTPADLQRYLDDYYRERGYDLTTGLPTRRLLRRLGLEELATGLELPEG